MASPSAPLRGHDEQIGLEREQLAPALVTTGELAVVRDEGEAVRKRLPFYISGAADRFP